MRRFDGSGLALAFFCGLALTLAGCPDDEPNPGDTSGIPDTTVDAAPDTPVTPDATADSTPDEGAPDGTPDSTPDEGAPDVLADTSQPDVYVPVVTCSADAECDDGLACTTDTCTTSDAGDAFCVWTLSADTCLINNVCHANGDAKAGSPCQACAAGTDAQAWTALADGTACDDGTACTENDACAAGACASTTLDCNDGDECSVDSCDDADGCHHTIDPLGGCDDGDACTEFDTCAAGSCAGVPLDCDDDNACTDDTCDSDAGCQYVNNTAPCDVDDDLCTDDACAEGTCVAGEALNCDDGNLCTINVCDAAVGCYTLQNNNPCCQGETSICDDGNPCTTDNCDAAGGGACSYEDNSANCDDDNICTSDDACLTGSCVGGDVACDDGNPCTVDACDPGQGGCVATIAADGVSCDDGLECSTDDACSAGVCTADTSNCTCVPVFQDGAKVDSLAVGVDDSAGEAVDVDGNGTRDNALGSIVGTLGANDAIVSSVAEGSILLLLEFRDLVGDGAFVLSMHQGALEPTPPNDACDFQTQTCNYLATPDLMDGDTCLPTLQLPCTKAGTAMNGGGPGNNFPFSIPLGEGIVLPIIIYNVIIEGTMTASGNVTTFDGVLGGAITKADLETALGTLDQTKPIGGFTPDQIVSFLSFLTDDIDTDNDDVADAMSIGLKLTAIDGNIVGLVP